ncbi:HNH endonuclease signature motif containing protein [Arthrobacter citreus]|uniref:HNH endonuclease signature motif containing protein n=1 Tax=Arthrobacter citreus TaxID=1670 RepID=UPI001478F7AC|nr:HNH endonuclease signature motif containing protein [Arthrobacter citreus]
MVEDHVPESLPEGFAGQLSLRGPEALGYAETVSALERLGMLISWAQAQQARVAARLEVLFARDIAEASGREEPALAMSLAAAEASTVLNIPHMTAMQLISESTRLCLQAPQTLARLSEGKIALQHARIILEETQNLPADILEPQPEPGAGAGSDDAAALAGAGTPPDGESGQLDLGLEDQGALFGQTGPGGPEGAGGAGGAAGPDGADGVQYGPVSGAAGSDGPGEAAAGAAVDGPAGAALTVRAAFERDLLAAAEGRTAAGFGRRARRLRESRFPDLIPARHREAKDKRRVMFQPLPDGMSCLSAIIAAEKGQAMFAALTGAAKAGKRAGDPRTMDQLRADTLTELLLTEQAGTQPTEPEDAPCPHLGTSSTGTGSPIGSGTGIGTGTEGAADVQGCTGTATGTGAEAGASTTGRTGSGSASTAAGTTSTAAGNSGQDKRPRRAERYRTQNRDRTNNRDRSKVRTEVMVLINADTLAGLDENPAELNGYGPISAETARSMILEALHWTPLLQDPATGEILTVGRTRRIPAGLKRWLQARDGTCRFPGCPVNVTHAEIDHTTPYAHGGPTDHTNLEHLCPKHHRFKTLGHWKARQPEAGTIEWNSPTGRTYTTDPTLEYLPSPRNLRPSDPQLRPETTPQPPDDDPPPF